jgi:hypothetical protein
MAARTVRGAVLAELRDYPGMRGSGLALTALALAADIDSPETSPTARAACTRELRETLDRLRELAPPREQSNHLDDLTARRAKRRRRAVADG